MLYDPKWDVLIDSAAVVALRAAKQIISNPERWTCGEYARTSTGHYVGVENPSAVSFCSIGALAIACGTSVKLAEETEAYTFLANASIEQGYNWPHDLNDKGGHAKAMAMFDRAIALAEAAQLPQDTIGVAPK